MAQLFSRSDISENTHTYMYIFLCGLEDKAEHLRVKPSKDVDRMDIMR